MAHSLLKNCLRELNVEEQSVSALKRLSIFHQSAASKLFFRCCISSLPVHKACPQTMLRSAWLVSSSGSSPSECEELSLFLLAEGLGACFADALPPSTRREMKVLRNGAIVAGSCSLVATQPSLLTIPQKATFVTLRYQLLAFSPLRPYNSFRHLCAVHYAGQDSHICHGVSVCKVQVMPSDPHRVSHRL